MANWWSVAFVVTLVVLIIVSYLFIKCQSPTVAQRTIPPPALPPPQLGFVFRADKNMDSKDLFMMKTPGKTNFPSIFSSDSEREAARSEARKFFKEHFGLSDALLSVAMVELAVNPEAGYYTKEGPIVDGGFVVPIIKGTVLKGKYGGEKGVIPVVAGVVAWGFYMFNGWKINYMSTCPMLTFKTYDGNYAPIDCYVKVLEAPQEQQAFVGLEGKAIGVYKNTMLNNGLNNITIRNVLTFPQ